MNRVASCLPRGTFFSSAKAIGLLVDHAEEQHAYEGGGGPNIVRALRTGNRERETDGDETKEGPSDKEMPSLRKRDLQDH